MRTLYWIPSEGTPPPRLNVFDGTGKRYISTPLKVPNRKGALMFKVPDNEKNNPRFEDIKHPWYSELPKGDLTFSSQCVDSGESALTEPPRTPVTREELIEILDNNGITYRKNQKSSTLWEKLPDDIARNIKLVESSVEVQT